METAVIRATDAEPKASDVDVQDWASLLAPHSAPLKVLLAA